jgi:hypothetical protein
MSIMTIHVTRGLWRGAAATSAATKVGIDANLLGYKYVHDRSSFTPDGAVAHVARAFSDSRVDVHIVCDNPTERHPSKRATCDRQAEAEKRGIELIIARAQLQSLLNVQDDSSQRVTDINARQKRIRSLENASNWVNYMCRRKHKAEIFPHLLLTSFQ